MPADVDAILRDPARLDALRRVALLDTPTEAAFDRLTRLAAAVLDAPVALINLVDADRQFFKSCIGIAEPLASSREMSVEHSFCKHAMADTGPLVLNDTREHPLHRTNPLIKEMGIVAYLGIPLLLDGVQPLGALCVIDTRPRAWSTEQVAILTDLAAAVLTEIDLRTTTMLATAQTAEREALLGRISDAFFALDRDWRFTYLNAQAEALLHSSAEELLGQSIRARYPELMDAPVYTHYQQALIHQEAVTFEQCFSPAQQWYQVRIHPADDGLSVFCQDVTERHKAEAEHARLYAAEQEARRLAQAALAERDAFLASISHDLRSPLTTISGMVQLLQRQLSRDTGPAAERMLPGLRTVQQATTQLAGMVSELVDLSQLQSGRQLELHREPVDLTALLTRCVQHAQRATTDHRWLWTPPSGQVIGTWDAARLERVVANLLGNALKYSPNGGAITVALSLRRRTGRACAEFSVTDEGLGIPAADLPHIFERFYRGSNVTGQIGGSGIGLAGARQIVEHHGGELTATSTEGHGSTFTVRLPLEP